MTAHGVDVGAALLDAAGNATTIACIGTAKNVGKTTAVIAIAASLGARGTAFAIVSSGRDGEAYDALDSARKPAIYLPAGTLFATARALLPRSPACEIVELTGERGALGSIAIARARAGGEYVVAGPSSASALRRIIDALLAAGAARVIVDGALDRLASLRSDDAVVIATGAPAAPTFERLVQGASELVARLRTPAADFSRPFVYVDGALTAEKIAQLAACCERRQIVVADATRIVARGRALRRLELRAEHVLRPVACTVASVARSRAYEPAAALQAVADGTGLPAFDVYACAGARAA